MELQKKCSRLAVIALALAAGASALSAADPNAEAVSLLTDLDDDINRWHGLRGGSVQPERDGLKAGMGRRLDRFSTVFDTGLGPLGVTPAAGPNRLFIRRSIGTLDRAAAIDPDDHELASSVAAAYIAVAQVQGHPSHRNLGQTRESAATYAKATRILARVRRQAPDYARGRSLASQARTSVYAYSRYPWFEPEVFVLLDLGGGREPGAPLRGNEGAAANNYGNAIGSGVAGDLGNLVQEVVRTKSGEILAAFGDPPDPASDVDLGEVRSRHARVEQKAQRVWDAAEELHGSLAEQGGLRTDVIGYLARLQIFLQEAMAGLEDSDGGRAQRNLVRAEYEIGRLGKAIGVSP